MKRKEQKVINDLVYDNFVKASNQIKDNKYESVTFNHTGCYVFDLPDYYALYYKGLPLAFIHKISDTCYDIHNYFFDHEPKHANDITRFRKSYGGAYFGTAINLVYKKIKRGCF